MNKSNVPQFSCTEFCLTAILFLLTSPRSTHFLDVYPKLRNQINAGTGRSQRQLCRRPRAHLLVDVTSRLQRLAGMLRRILNTCRAHARGNTQHKAHRTQYRRGAEGQNAIDRERHSLPSVKLNYRMMGIIPSSTYKCTPTTTTLMRMAIFNLMDDAQVLANQLIDIWYHSDLCHSILSWPTGSLVVVMFPAILSRH